MSDITPTVIEPDYLAAVDLVLAALDGEALWTEEPVTPREAALARLVLSYAALTLPDDDSVRASLRGTAALTAAREALDAEVDEP